MGAAYIFRSGFFLGGVDWKFCGKFDTMAHQ